MSRGHFRYESGHHGDLWLDLDRLLVDARRARDWASVLARRPACQPELVCGPLTGGAFLAQLLAAEIGAGFVFAERIVSDDGATRYRVPGPLRKAVSGRRVLLVDDAINAGSALRSAWTDLSSCDARLAGIACLIALGETASRNGVPLYRLGSFERQKWAPHDCPLCAAGAPLIDHLATS